MRSDRRLRAALGVVLTADNATIVNAPPGGESVFDKPGYKVCSSPALCAVMDRRRVPQIVSAGCAALALDIEEATFEKLRYGPGGAQPPGKLLYSM